jgi:hypothetical protein
MKSLSIGVLFFVLFVLSSPHSNGAESSSFEAEVKKAAQTLQEEVKKGVQATESTAKEIGRGASEAVEKSARQVRESLSK